MGLNAAPGLDWPRLALRRTPGHVSEAPGVRRRKSPCQPRLRTQSVQLDASIAYDLAPLLVLGGKEGAELLRRRAHVLAPLGGEPCQHVVLAMRPPDLLIEARNNGRGRAGGGHQPGPV